LLEEIAMTRPTLFSTILLAFAVVLLLLTASGQSGSSSIQPVAVTNFPETQNIEGDVRIRGSVRLSEMVTFKDLFVPPVDPGDTTRLVEAGTLVADGFANVVLSLHGQVKGSVHREGEVGAFLVPDEASIQQAFNELGMVHFALRVAAPAVSTRTPFFASEQPRYMVGFQSYKILLFNTTDKTVTVDLYAYLTS
jgi:hypothetical protein